MSHPCGAKNTSLSANQGSDVGEHCEACGETSTTSRLLVRDYRYAVCARCGSARLHPLPDHSPDDYYDEGYFEGNRVGGYSNYDADGTVHAINAVHRLDRLDRYVGSGEQHLIDIGCASGYVLDEARRRAWSCAGVDVSPWGRQRSADKGHSVHRTFAAAAAERQPTVITLFQVLEHMTDAADQVAEQVDALPPGGLIAIETWDSTSRVARMMGTRWQQLSPPSVVHLLSRRGLDQLLERLGMTVASTRPTSKRVSVELVAAVVTQKVPVLNRGLRHLGDSWVGRLSVPYRLGDLITVIARKP